MQHNKILIRQLGLQPYEPVSQAMHEFTDARDEDTLDEIWLVEHHPVFTQGQAGKAEHVLVPGDIPVIQSDRGGQVTYHGPGQQVMYVLLDLKRRKLGVRELVTIASGMVISSAVFSLVGPATAFAGRGTWLAYLCAVLLGSCGSTAAAPAESTAPADPLTGQQLLYPEQRAAAVVIENTTDSTTQWGIGSASVVLEAMTESGSSTELCLVYPALSAMPVVGPVTRGQDLYWRLLSGQQVLPIQCGSSAYAKRYLEYYNLRAVDAQEVGRNAFVSTGYSWDNTPLWRTSGKAVAAVLDSLSISTAVNQNTASGSESETAGVLPTLLPQRDTGHLPDANAADAVKATVNFQSGGATGFVYDDALAAYGMLHADGTPQLDANTGTQAVFDNLLILYSGSSLRDDGRTLDYDLSMGGGVWLNGGHLWQVTWTQGTQSTLALYDSNGKPLNLPAGRSYIALLSSLTGQELLVQSSTGEALVGAG